MPAEADQLGQVMDGLGQDITLIAEIYRKDDMAFHVNKT